MSTLNGRRRRMMVPSVLRLEPRRLLTVGVNPSWQTGVDLVGPTVSVGPDGIQDIDLRLSGIQNYLIYSIRVQGPSGFEWEYRNAHYDPNHPDGWANAEYFPESNPTQGDLYINPSVDSNLSNGSTGNPLDSSTGPPITLGPGDGLTVTVKYNENGSIVTDNSLTTTLPSNFATLPMAANSTPANVIMDTMSVTNDGQMTSPSQNGTYNMGDVDLHVTGLIRTITTATLSDQAGAYWSFGDPTAQHELYVSEASDGQSADIYFAPVRNETVCPPGVSPATDMSLRITYSNGSDAAQYVTQFAGAAWNPVLLANPLNTHSESISNASNSVMAEELIGALEYNSINGGQEYDTVTLPAGATIVLTQPLEINHSVQVIGNGTTIQFDASWTSSTHYAIYLDPSLGSSIKVDFSNFSIDFGASNIWYDPETVDETQYAVIGLRLGSNLPFTLDLTGMSITGPPALDPTPPSPPTQPTSSYRYAGENGTQLLSAGAGGSGSITGCTFQGGTVAVNGGPWEILDNTDLGALANTFSPGAFAASGPHDLVFEGNHVSQYDPSGTEFRLINFGSGSGYNDIIFNNTFVGGSVGNEDQYIPTDNPPYQGINYPEPIIFEGDNTWYEGDVGSVSGDGYILTIPKPSASIYSRGFMNTETGPGMLVSIVNTLNPDGSPDSHVGQWFPIAQLISDDPPTFLMDSPLPAGSFVISIGSGFRYERILDNTLNLAGTASQGIHLTGDDFDLQIEHNTIIGGTYFSPHMNTGIIVEAYYANPDPNSQGTFGIPYAWTHTVAFGITIEYNTIVNSPGGIIVDSSTADTSIDRNYLQATVEFNTFEWTQDWLNWWSTP